MSGSIQVVGIGPGAADLMAPAARRAIESADVIIGYQTYLALIDGIADKTTRITSKMKQEVERVRQAIEMAHAGSRVALISGGDAGIYGMAGLVFEMLKQLGDDSLTVEVIPGITALSAAAALVGAPLMTDFAVISLSDQLIPLEKILKRVEMAAKSDFVICLYNPRSHKRRKPFENACQILCDVLDGQTPVAVVRAAYRPQQAVTVLPLCELPQAEVDMLSIVIIGNRDTMLHNGKLVTRRGYDEKYDLVSNHGQIKG